MSHPDRNPPPAPAPASTRVLIADDAPFVRGALKALLLTAADLEVITVAPDADSDGRPLPVLRGRSRSRLDPSRLPPRACPAHCPRSPTLPGAWPQNDPESD